MIRTSALLLFLIFGQHCIAQLQLTNLDKTTIPRNIQYKGEIVRAVRWQDQLGDNIVILSSGGKKQTPNSPDAGYLDAAIFAYHFLVRDDSAQLTWKLQDFVKECPVDLFLYFVDKSFAITDLNSDGKAEIWIMYKISCQGDVSPVPMKIIMYQDDKKFAVRGTTRVQPSETGYMGGEYAFDQAFKGGPALFRKYADELWSKHKKEDWKQ